VTSEVVRENNEKRTEGGSRQRNQTNMVSCYTHDNLSNDTVILSLNVHRRFVGFLQRAKLAHQLNHQRRLWSVGRTERTISNKMSPVVNASPSFFFQLAIPPSVMVGDIAGMANLESAWEVGDVRKAVSGGSQCRKCDGCEH
jgi:hypothetical protein